MKLLRGEINLNRFRTFNAYFKLQILNRLTPYIYIILTLYLMLNYNFFLSQTITRYRSISVYDLVIFIFSSYKILFFLLSFLFLISIKNIISKDHFNKYLLLKFRNRNQWFMKNILIIAGASLLFVIVILIILILQSLLHFSFTNNWTDVSMAAPSYIHSSNPFVVTLFSSTLVFCYFFTIGLIFYVSNLFFKQSSFSFILAIFMNVFSIFAYNTSGKSLVMNFFFVKNTLIHEQTWSSSLYLDILSKIIYWIILIVILIRIGKRKISRMDFKFEEKKMKKFLNIIKYNLLSIYDKSNLFIVFLVFSFVYMMTLSMYGKTYSITELFFLSFQGPLNLQENIIEFMKWLFYQIPLLLIVGNHIYKEMNERSIYVIPRIGSKRLWLYGIIASDIITIFIYYGIGFILTFLYSLILKSLHFISNTATISHFNMIVNTQMITSMFLMLCIGSFLLILIQLTLTLISGNSSIAFTFNILIMFLSILVRDPELNKFLPGNQGVFIKHYIYNFSLIWSTVYVGVVSLIFLIINIRFIN